MGIQTAPEEEIEDDQDHTSKCLFQFQGAIIDLLKPLKRYGQTEYVDMVIPEIVHLAWQLRYQLEGVDEPLVYYKPTYND